MFSVRERKGTQEKWRKKVTAAGVMDDNHKTIYYLPKSVASGYRDFFLV